jgi:hypothetical protein
MVAALLASAPRAEAADALAFGAATLSPLSPQAVLFAEVDTLSSACLSPTHVLAALVSSAWLCGVTPLQGTAAPALGAV